jgi:hypothetical protein
MSNNKKAWLVARFQPTAFFSLRPAGSTSSGGKSLLAPTPFAIKMALLDVALRTLGSVKGEELFPSLRDLEIAVRLPAQAVVNNTFVKIMRPHKGGVKETDTGLTTPMGNTIAFREYITFQNDIFLAFHGLVNEILSSLLWHINYFGKRGGFFQLQAEPEVYDWSAEEFKQSGYTLLTQPTTEFSVEGLLQMLDDCGPQMTFEHANIYSGKNIKLGKERILLHVVLPYRLVRSSKSYSYYERIES